MSEVNEWVTIKGYPRYEINREGVIRVKAYTIDKVYEYPGKRGPVKYYKEHPSRVIKRKDKNIATLYSNGVPFYESIYKLISIHFEE